MRLEIRMIILIKTSLVATYIRNSRNIMRANIKFCLLLSVCEQHQRFDTRGLIRFHAHANETSEKIRYMLEPVRINEIFNNTSRNAESYFASCCELCYVSEYNSVYNDWKYEYIFHKKICLF